MDKVKEEIKFPKRNKEWMKTVSKTQLAGIEEAEKILEDILRIGFSSADVEYREDMCYDIENLIDYNIPNVLREFRHFFSILYHIDNLNMYPKILDHINYLLVLLDQSKKYLKCRSNGGEPDFISTIETHIGSFGRRRDFLDYKLYEENADIIQLSFESTKDVERMLFIDKGYWVNLKNGKIFYTRRQRPTRAAQYIKLPNSEFNVLQPQKLFVYPGKINNRIRWDEAQQREVTTDDRVKLLNYAELNYIQAVNTIKDSFKDPLADHTPTLLIKLHKTFVNGTYLVLEDEQGGLLTVADMSKDNAPTAELLRTILPSAPKDCALLVRVNDDTENDLFSVKPLSVITPNKIIRLLY